MAYKIEDINWDTMPEGATHFTLESEHTYFTWYRIDESDTWHWWAYNAGKPKWHPYSPEAEIKFSVETYHPESILKREEERQREESCKAVQGFVDHILNKHKLMLSAYTGEARRAADDYCKLIMEGKV